MTQRICQHPRRKTRQRHAAERQESRDKRTNEEQLALITQRPGKSAREVARLS